MALPQPKTYFGDYWIVKELGRGGMGVVYLAYDDALDRHVALKVVSDSLLADETFLRRFQREARMAAKVKHPHLTTVHQAGIVDGVPFIAMEYVEGENLADRIRENAPLEADQAVGIVRDVAAGLAVMHDLNLVHRDIKPANIMIRPNGDACLMDFGLARPTGDLSQITSAQAILGTPIYIAPEIYDGKRATPRSDVYALGVVMYEMLVGANPFKAEHRDAARRRIISGTIAPLRDAAPDLPIYINALVEQLMALDPSKRPENGAAALDAIDAAQSSSSISHTSTTNVISPGRMKRKVRKSARLSWIRKRRRAARVLVMLAPLLFLSIAGEPWERGPFGAVVHSVFDFRYLGEVQRTADPRVILVDLAEWPPGDQEAPFLDRVVSLLNEHNVAAIGLDFILTDESRLTEVMDNHWPDQLHTAFAPLERLRLVSALQEDGSVHRPAGPLAELPTGFANTWADRGSRSVRRTRLSPSGSSQPEPPFAVAVANAADISFQERPEIGWLNYGALDQIPRIRIPVSAEGLELLEQSLKLVGSNNRLVIVGSTATTDDIHYTPLRGHRARISGLSLQGVVLENLLSGALYTGASARHTGFVVFFVSAAAFLAGTQFRRFGHLAAAFVAIAIVLVASLLSLRYSATVIPILWPALAGVGSSLAGVAYGRRRVRREHPRG